MAQLDFHLPSLGADMEVATLAQWLKKPGDTVHRGETIAVVETQKGLIDVECFEEGVLSEVLVQPGTEVPVGAVLARLTGTGPPAGAPAAPPGAVSAPPATSIPPRSTAEVLKPVPAGSAAAAPEGLRISPAARRRAAELGVSLQSLATQAAGAVIRLEDVSAMAARGATVASAPSDDRSAMRVAIGHAMARSKREIPHYYLEHSVDMSAARAWLPSYNAAKPVAERIIEGVLIVKAVALAAARAREFNGYFRDGRFEPAGAVHVGTAIALRGGGLIAPALLDAARKDLGVLMREFSDLVSRARTAHLRSSEFAAATITVTSLGEDGAEALFPVINPPQVAIVGAGRVMMRPWVQEGAVVVRPVVRLTLAADHRVSDGRSGSHFLRSIGDLLAAPDKL